MKPGLSLILIKEHALRIGFKVHTLVNIKITVFWHVTPSDLVYSMNLPRNVLPPSLGQEIEEVCFPELLVYVCRARID